MGLVAQRLSAQDQEAQLEAHLAVMRVLASTGLPQPSPLLASQTGSMGAEEGNPVQAVPGTSRASRTLKTHKCRNTPGGHSAVGESRHLLVSRRVGERIGHGCPDYVHHHVAHTRQ